MFLVLDGGDGQRNVGVGEVDVPGGVKDHLEGERPFLLPLLEINILPLHDERAASVEVSDLSVVVVGGVKVGH